MSMAAGLLRARDGEDGNGWAFGLLAIALGAAVFYVDTYTDIEGAIAVLYVVVMMMAAQVMTRSGLLVLAAACVALMLASYFLTHGPEPDLQTTMRLTVALAALCVTTALLLKTETARAALIFSNAALRESEARYRSIFDRTRVALWERDYSKLRDHVDKLKAQGIVDVRQYARTHPDLVDESIGMIRTVAANEAAKELLGVGSSPFGALGRSNVPGQGKFVELLQAMLDGERVFEDKVEVRTESGENKLVLLSISFPEDPTAFNRVVVSMVDVTQREMAQKALAEAQAELTRASKAATIGALSASLAHELNQPLGAIVVNAQTLVRWLDRDPPDLAAARRSVERMVRDSQRASDIIQNTRSLLSQSDRKGEAIDLEALVEETMVLVEHDLQRSGTRIRVDRKSSPPSFQGVKIELQQVLINLLTNAIQAMDGTHCPDRLITVTIDCPDADHVSISVRDTGPGIAGETTEKLFVPFYTTKETGMGMGLAICRSTVEARGGTLEAANHAAGGAVFEMRLPTKPEIENA